MKRVFLLHAVLLIANLAWGRSNVRAEVRFEVRASQSLFQPFDGTQPVKIYVRCLSPGYLTIYQIRPDSGLSVLYPQPHHHWRELVAKKEYSLSDIADDLVLTYPGVDGFVYLGMIMTTEPVYLVPWLKQAFSEHGVRGETRLPKSLEKEFGDLVEKVEADVRFRLGKPDLSSFALIPLLMKPRVQIFAADWHESPQPLRYFYDGQYHLVEPDLPPSFPGALLQGPQPFPRRGSTSAGKAILPSPSKPEPTPKKSPRRDKKN